MSLLNQPIKFAAERFSSSVWGYLNLWSYFDSRLKHRVSNRKTHNIISCIEFYRGIKDGSIKHGDRVVLKEFFVSEWAPRAAGGLVSMIDEKKLDITDYYRLPTSFKPNSAKLKSGDLIPPFGSIRLPLVKKKDIILSAVSANEYHVDMGIVIAVTDSIYSGFLSKQVKNNCVEATIQGYVDLFHPLERIPSLPNVSELIDNNAMSLPSIVLRVVSPLDIKFRSHDSHPRLNAWFLRRTEYDRPPITGLEVSFVKAKFSKPQVIFGDLIEYNYVNWTVFDNNPEELINVRETIAKNIFGLSIEGFPPMNKTETDNLLSTFKEIEFEKDDYGIKTVEQLTEFDGRQSIYQPLISLQIDPRLTPTKSHQFLKEIQKIENSQKNDF